MMPYHGQISFRASAFIDNLEAEIAGQKQRIVALEAQLAEANERLAKAEAERVEVFNARHYCQNVCHGDCRLYDEDDNCSAQDLWRYLRDHHMIREAE